MNIAGYPFVVVKADEPCKESRPVLRDSLFLPCALARTGRELVRLIHVLVHKAVEVLELTHDFS